MRQREGSHQPTEAVDRKAVDRLRAALGDALSTDPQDLREAMTDKSGHQAAAAPLAVVHARSTDDVQRLMRIATELRLPVVPRGAGTGLAGGAIGGGGEVVLSLRGMNRLLEVSIDDELAVVEPGIINADLNALLAPHGLWFAPDPASRAISTVGGNIATNAGGLLCAKYGVTREAVLGLKAVLADGRLIEVGRRSIKGVTGLDLTSLLIGSEGTLGIIVEATLRLRPLVPGTVQTIGATFPDVAGAVDACAGIPRAGIRPAVMELLDAAALQAIGEYLHQDLAPAGVGAYLLLQLDGPAAADDAAAAMEVLRVAGADPQLAATAADGERLVEIRRSFHAAMEARGTVLIEDVCVPRSALPAMFEAIDRIARDYRIDIPTVAHAGDGNLHPNFAFQSLDGQVPDHVWEAAGALFEAALELGGTLTGEHGVGILKKRWLQDELGAEQWELQRGLKAVFDPLGILNPGKVF